MWRSGHTASYAAKFQMKSLIPNVAIRNRSGEGRGEGNLGKWERTSFSGITAENCTVNYVILVFLKHGSISQQEATSTKKFVSKAAFRSAQLVMRAGGMRLLHEEEIRGSMDAK